MATTSLSDVDIAVRREVAQLVGRRVPFSCDAIAVRLGLHLSLVVPLVYDEVMTRTESYKGYVVREPGMARTYYYFFIPKEMTIEDALAAPVPEN